MNEQRPYASLSSGLLARKGGARPAMRPRPLGMGPLVDDLGWNDMGYGSEFDEPAEHVPSSISALTPAPKPAPERQAEAPAEPTPAPVPPPVRAQQQAIADRLGADPFAAPELPEPAAETPQPIPADIVNLPKREARAQGRKAAFTLRLDTERHLRLRLASAVTGRSAQQLVCGALDTFLETLPEIDALAEQLPARASKRS